jgi:hypothetical protein
VAEILFDDYKPVLFEHDFFAVNTTKNGENSSQFVLNVVIPFFLLLLHF